MTRQQKDQQAVARFNQAHQVGAEVLYWSVLPRRDGDEPLRTRTRSPAMHVSSGPVIFLEGKSGYVALSHVEPLP